MKIVLLEPLGIPDEVLVEKVREAAGDNEVIYYNTRREDTETLIERSRDADAVVLSNFKKTAGFSNEGENSNGNDHCYYNGKNHYQLFQFSTDSYILFFITIYHTFFLL